MTEYERDWHGDRRGDWLYWACAGALVSFVVSFAACFAI